VSALGALAARSYYRLLLLTYPRAFRRRDGAEAAGVFVDACCASRANGGLPSMVRRLLHALVDVPRGGIQERLQGGESRPTPARPPRAPRGWRALPGELATDLRFAVRSLRRRPGWTAAVAVTLALGIGANTAIFSIIDATLLASSPYPDAGRLVFLSHRTTEEDVTLNASVEELLRYRDEVDAFEHLEARAVGLGVLGQESGTRRVSVERVTPGFLDVLGLEPVAGRLLREDDFRPDAEPVALMPEDTWRRLYGADPGVVGETVLLDGVVQIVVGVMPDVRGLDDAFVKPLPLTGPDARTTLALGYAWLREGVSLEEAQAQLAPVSTGEDERWGAYVGELKHLRNYFWYLDEFRSGVLSLMAAVFLVLTIACVNVANLLLAAAGTRTGELALRVALGAGRARLVRFLLAESLLLSSLGAAIGVGVAIGGIALMKLMAPVGELGDALDRVRVDGTVLAYAAGIALLAGLAFGLLPAARAVSGGQRSALQGADSRAGGARQRLRGTMVAVETALALVLLVAAGLTARSFVTLRFTDPGFDADRIMSLWVIPPPASYPETTQQRAFFESLAAEIERVPGIEAAALGAGVTPPSDLVTGGEMLIEGREGPIEAWITLSMVEGGLLEFFGIPLLAGRDLDEADVRAARAGGEQAVVVNRALARRYWPDGNALGARFRLSLDYDQRWNRVVGIAADVRQRGLEVPEEGLHMYRPLGEDRRYGELVLRLHPEVEPPVAELRAAIFRVDPQIPTDTLDTAAAGLLDSMSHTRFRAALFGAFGLLAVALAALGIFGVVAYTVVQRTAEMGIRLALGATPRDVRRLVLWQGSAPVLAGISVGLVLSLGLTRLMAGFLYGVAPVDPPTFLATAAILGAVGLAATWIPARRATAVDPVLALRRA
jgi:predicted permease